MKMIAVTGIFNLEEGEETPFLPIFYLAVSALIFIYSKNKNTVLGRSDENLFATITKFPLKENWMLYYSKLEFSFMIDDKWILHIFSNLNNVYLKTKQDFLSW